MALRLTLLFNGGIVGLSAWRVPCSLCIVALGESIAAAKLQSRYAASEHTLRGRKLSHRFRLRFRISEIGKWADLYDYPGEPELIAGPVAQARDRGYLEHSEFLEIAEWKSRRPRKRYAANSPAWVEEVTRVALEHETSPHLAIEVLTILAGVRWPTASVILHFCHHDPYPILDFRALWSLSVDVPSQYTYKFWDEYLEFTRSLARDAHVDMRTLDRALWKYSKLHQHAA